MVKGAAYYSGGETYFNLLKEVRGSDMTCLTRYMGKSKMGRDLFVTTG